ncbi:hypothetical protein N7468_010807 [Penicillium chermesinum]|uniref:Uncharacterized protein n=1 Tax=Penicillium chermesinum TaxID=63820 RepID=A0A9W9N8B9_9EURO|nr:uncharacterized protein N7468_010807 [Penicillium chermesinum]KAJ5215128.1 hypothetical protein N7468_010807 [Penicillium chermesinum]KAJ6141383.1 hypothetical protein N7470_009773 [Penicillium chermesinum]
MACPSHELAITSFHDLIVLELHAMNVYDDMNTLDYLTPTGTCPPYGIYIRSSSLSAHRTAFLKLSRTRNRTSVTGNLTRMAQGRLSHNWIYLFDKSVSRPPHQPLETW